MSTPAIHWDDIGYAATLTPEPHGNLVLAVHVEVWRIRGQCVENGRRLYWPEDPESPATADNREFCGRIDMTGCCDYTIKPQHFCSIPWRFGVLLARLHTEARAIMERSGLAILHPSDWELPEGFPR